MTLALTDAEIIREASCFSFFMRVFIWDDALAADEFSHEESDPRGQLDSEGRSFEAIASEKYCKGRVSATGLVGSRSPMW
jgi:hypothetical protein